MSEKRASEVDTKLTFERSVTEITWRGVTGPAFRENVEGVAS